MKTNKLLSVVLTLCVLLAAFSLTALAAEGVTTAEALAAALTAGGEVRLDADITSVGAPVTVPAGVTATLDLNGHTLTVSKHTAKKDQVLVEGSLTLTDSVGTGKICSDYTGTSGRVVSVSGSGSLQLVGGTITTEGMEKSGSAVYVAANCKFTMSGGSVYADAKRNNSAVSLANAKASMEMSGGTITAIPTADSGDDVYAISAAYSPVKISAGTVSGHPAMSVGNGSAITGGVYNGVVKAKAGTITGGTFTDVDVISLAGYVDETVYACEKQADGSYTVAKAEFTAVATITGADGVVTRYAAATEAFSALKGGDTLKLLADIGTAAEPLPYGIVVTDGDVNVNLNAKTLIIGYDAAAAAAAGVPGYAAGVGIVNGGSGTVTVSGNGTLDVSNYTGTDGIAVWARTGSITVKSGTFINKSNEEATVYVGTNDDSAPVLKIAGGTYKNIAEGNYKYDESRTPLTFNIYNGKTADALKISAGSFYGNNDPYLGDDQVKGSILATEMTGVRKNVGYYVVANGQTIQLLDANGGAKNFYTDVTKAFAGAADGDTLILLKNTSVSKQLNVTKAITIDLGGYTLTNSYDGSGYSLLTRAAVTMKNGTYKSTKGSARGIGAVADFTLENATLSAAGLVGLGCSAPDATYTVKNSTVIGNYALANFVNNATINIENSTITGSGTGIYHNGSYSGLKLTATGSTITAAATGATNGIYVSGSTSTMTAAGAQQVTLTNCTVSGGTAVEVKYTDLTLTDCTVTATAETPSYTQDDNGAATTGFAVVSTDNTTGAATPAPKGTITIQGANGSYKGQVGLASLETVKTEYADFKDTTYAVSGGSFTKAVLPEYCAAGFVPAANADGTYGVKVAPVAKIGTVEYATLAEAIAAAKDGDTVTLIDDLDISATGLTIAAAKTVTLDLDGHTLKAANTNTGNIKVLGKLTLCDSTDTAKNGTGTGKVWTDTPYIYNKQDKVLIAAMDGGTFTMESGLIDTASSIADNANDGQFAVSVQNEHADATVIINGGHIKAGWYAVAGNGTDITYNGNITVNGGILESVADYAIYHPHTGTTTVNGGVIFGAAGGISLNRGKLIVNDGTITSKGTGTTGNWGDGTGNQQAAAINVNAKYETTAVEIKGGKITAEKDAILLTNGRNGTVAVSGGSFSSEIKPEYCAEGFVPAANADGTYGVKVAPVAKIGTVEYATLADAIAAAKDGDTVTLTADINTPETSYYIQKSLTIDLGGKTLTGSGYDGVFNIEGENAAVLIKNGKIVAVEQTGTAGKYTMAVWACAAGCEVTLEDLDVSQQITHTDDKQMDMIYTSNGTIIINSGCFASGTPAWTLNCKDSAYKAGTAKIIVNGGTFVGYDPRNNVAEGAGTSFVAPGVGVDAVDGSFTAKAGMTAQVMDAKGASVKAFATLAEAIAAAAKGSTVTLLADTRENVTIDKALTLDLNGFTLNGGTVEAKPALTITARTVTIKDSSEAQTGTIMREDTAENSGVSSHYVIDIQGNAWVMFESGKVTNNSGSAAGKGASLVRIGDDSVAKYPGLVIKGGTFTQDNFVVIKVGRGYLTLKGGTLNSANSYAIENWFSATIKGGTVNGPVAAWTYSDGSNSTLTVEGGTINGNVFSVNYGSAESKVAKVKITGGTVNGALGTYIYSNGLTATEDATKATIGITGGTFANDPTKYVVEGATVTKNSEGKFGVEKAYLAKVGNTSYYTMEEAFKAQTASGEPVVLLRDYTTRGTFNSGSSNRTVDLNGHTWTYTGTDFDCAAFEINYPDVTLTVKNGTVVSGSMVGLIPSAMGGTIKYDNSGLVLEGVTATANGNSGIETNGNNTNDTVTLKNSTLNVPNGFGIYFPSSGTLTLDNSTVNAKTMGVQVCAGSLSINEGSAVTVTGDAVPKAEDDGAIQDGAAISVVNRTGYKGLGTVTVSGGKFTAKEGNSAIKAYDWANKTESDFTADKGTVAVSGGTFSSEIKSEYCAEGFEPVANTDGTYTVGAKKAVEVWTGYTGTSVAAYATVAEAAANLGENKWIVITGDYTLTADFTIPADVRLDVADGAVLTVANGVTLTVAADAKRLAARTGAAIVNNGTILVCGTSYSNGYVMVQEGGTLDLGTLTVPEGCFLDNNGTNYFAAVATYSITYADGTIKQAGSLNNLSGAVRVTLLKNVTDFGRSFSSTDALADNFVFDLGGHTLSGKANASSQVMTIAAPMTVTNGTIVYASSNEHYGAIQTNDNVTFDASVTVDGGVGYALRTNGYGKTVVFNGTAVTNGEYAITGNGAESGGLVVDCSLVVGESANISAVNGIAIYHPMLGTVSVTGGKISGHTGIEMCAGKLVVSGGEITSTGANHDETGSTDTIKDGAAISIINRNYPGGVPTLEVTGGIVKATGEGALAVKAYDYTADKVAEWTTAGEFVNISGGTFSSEIKSEYCAEGFEPVANTDGTYGVAEKARVGLSDNMMIIPRGLADGKYTMLILAAIDSLDYAEVGFKVMVYNDGKAVSDETMYSTTTVYTSVKDGAGKVWKPDDSELGDTKCKYLFASTMEIDASDKDAFTLDAYVRVVPYATDYDGNVLVKNTFNIPVTYFFN